VKILFLCHRFPFPPDGGAKIRPYHMIRHLHQEHEVVVGSLVRSDEEEQEAGGLAEHCTRHFHARVGRFGPLARMLLRVPTRVPSSMGYFHAPALRRFVRAELAQHEYDLILVHCSSMAQYVTHVRDIPKLLDFTDMDSQKWLTFGETKSFPLSWGYALEGRKLARAEAELAKQFDLSTVATAAEQETLDGFGTGAATGWFPNGVDASYFTPGEELYDTDEIVFLGRMDYYPNAECMVRFCDRVLPLVQERRPTAKLTIVGANPLPEVAALAERAGVSVTGSVPDVRPYLHKAAVTVAPLTIARGTQNKILESLVARVPVVCTSLAAAGVDAVPGTHLLAVDTPAEQADAILLLLDDPAERERFADAGRKRMLSHHDWEASMRRLDKLIERLLPAKAPA